MIDKIKNDMVKKEKKENEKKPNTKFLEYFGGYDVEEKFEKLLKSWDPKKYMKKQTNLRETHYRNSFKEYLENKFHIQNFVKEEKVRNSKVDLSIKVKRTLGETKYLIEFKYGLSNHGELQRLKGQIQDYEKGKNEEGLFIIFIEDKKKKVNRNFIEELKNTYGKRLFGKMLSVYIKQDEKGIKSVERIF